MDETGLGLLACPTEWWAGHASLLERHVHLGDPPWQEAECRRLWEIHGPERFAGLDLFGVVS